MHWATHDEAKVRQLLAKGANVNARQAQGRTPHYLAAQLGNQQVKRSQRTGLTNELQQPTPQPVIGLPQELVDQLKIVKAARDFKAEREHHERDKLIREVRDLRTFERDYRQRLESWLLELGDFAAFRDYSEAREIIEEGLRDLGSGHGIETSDS